MAGLYAIGLLLQLAHAFRPRYGRPQHDDTCDSIAPLLNVLDDYNAASSLCSSVLSMAPHTSTSTSTKLLHAVTTVTSSLNRSLLTATASTVQLPQVTIIGNSSTTTVLSNSTRTLTLAELTITAPPITSLATITSTTTLCGNATAATNLTAAAKRDAHRDRDHGHRPGSRPDFKHAWGHSDRPGGRHNESEPIALEGVARSKLSMACSCMSLPTETSTSIHVVTRTSSSTVVAVSSGVITKYPNRTMWNSTIVHPIETRTTTATPTVRPSTTITPTLTSTIEETTTVLIGEQTGAPTVVLANPTPITGEDPDGLATQYYDDEIYPIDLPFEIQLYAQKSNNLRVSINGWIALSNDTGPDDHYSFNNAALPFRNTDDEYGLPDTAFAPYWNDLFISENTEQGLYYEISGEAPNRNVSFEWYTSLFMQPSGYYHFIATFQEAEPRSAIFTYYQANGERPYNTGKYGTIGVQSFLHDEHAMWSFNALVEPGLELTYDPRENVIRRTNAVTCEA